MISLSIESELRGVSYSRFHKYVTNIALVNVYVYCFINKNVATVDVFLMLTVLYFFLYFEIIFVTLKSYHAVK